jgi:hypothetical protein
MQPNDLDSHVYPLREDVRLLSQAGYVTKAREEIAYLLSHDKVDDLERNRLELEDHLLELRTHDFPYDGTEALSLLRTIRPDATMKDLEQLRTQGIIPFSLVDGAIHYHRRFLDTLRKDVPTEERKTDIALRDEMIARMKQRGRGEADVVVHIGFSLKEEAIREGKTVSVDLPVPVRCPFIKQLKILRQSGELVGVDATSSDRRCAHFRGVPTPNKEFWIEYGYTIAMDYHPMDQLEKLAKPSWWHGKDQVPYLVRSRYLEDLAKNIVGDEPNPITRARLIYRYITTHVSYAYMPSYQTIPNLAEYGASMRRGDCGIQAALFINLCRASGIKAGWMGGMYVTPQGISNHDWARFSIPGLPERYADCSFGGSAYRDGATERWDHYFGNLDPMRLCCTLLLAPSKETNRSQWIADPTDNQEGEAWYDDEAIPRDLLIDQRHTVKFTLHG